MNEEQDAFARPKSARGYSPRPVTITVPPGQEVRIVQGAELAFVFSDGTTKGSPSIIDGGPGDSTSPKKG
jgi:hypothetical protein